METIHFICIPDFLNAMNTFYSCLNQFVQNAITQVHSLMYHLALNEKNTTEAGETVELKPNLVQAYESEINALGVRLSTLQARCFNTSLFEKVQTIW